MKGFSFYDFDKGKYTTPPYGGNDLEWRINMTKWWLKVADKESDVQGVVPVIMGLSLYPEKILHLPEAAAFEKNIQFAHLFCSPDERKKRLEKRGDAHHWGGTKTGMMSFLLL